MTIRKTFLATLLSVALLLAGCSDTSSTDDVHSAPRETKTWENIDISTFDQAQLLGHLNLLASEAVLAAEAGETVEFHHLEVAITPVVEALEANAGGNAEALATLKLLKELARKFHIAGHDGNSKIGQKLAAKISDLSTRLAGQL